MKTKEEQPSMMAFLPREGKWAERPIICIDSREASTKNLRDLEPNKSSTVGAPLSYKCIKAYEQSINHNFILGKDSK